MVLPCNFFRLCKSFVSYCLYKIVLFVGRTYNWHDLSLLVMKVEYLTVLPSYAMGFKLSTNFSMRMFHVESKRW